MKNLCHCGFPQDPKNPHKHNVEDMQIKDYLEVLRQHILKSDEDIDRSGLWKAYWKVAEYIKNTQQSYKDNKSITKTA
jgi:hypothetical protein